MTRTIRNLVLLAALGCLTANVGHGCTADFTGPDPSRCGDSTCAPSEDPATCPSDCPAACGDGFCTHAEDLADCPADCEAACGDRVCSATEDYTDCPQDCPTLCGDGECAGSEDPYNCPADCQHYCGDGICEQETEDASTCEADCPAVCGDGYVTHDEACDDGNNQPGDGCDQECNAESIEVDCDNSVDDDGDGTVDCDDTDCSAAAVCVAHVTCDDMWSCLVACGTTQPCIDTCANTSCVSAVDTINALGMCLDDNCATECGSGLSGSDCQLCLDSSCAVQLANCAADTCP